MPDAIHELCAPVTVTSNAENSFAGVSVSTDEHLFEFLNGTGIRYFGIISALWRVI
jgi:hypothetical protein